MPLLLEAHFRLEVVEGYLPGIHNFLAGDLSRNWLLSFHSKVPSADPLATPMPLHLPDVLLDTSQDWTSLVWTQLFCDTVSDSTQKTYRTAVKRSCHFASHLMYQHHSSYRISIVLFCSHISQPQGLAPQP